LGTFLLGGNERAHLADEKPCMQMMQLPSGELLCALVSTNEIPSRIVLLPGFQKGRDLKDFLKEKAAVLAKKGHLAL
jgi:hypothetical protein